MASKKTKPKERRDYGSGSVYESPKGSGKWFAALRFEGEPKPLRRRANSEQAAKAALAELEELKQKQIDVAKGSQTFQSWLSAFHEEKIRLTKPTPRTIEFNHSAISRYIGPKMGAFRLMDIRPHHIQTFVDEVYMEIQDEYRETKGYDGARTAHAVAFVVKEAVTLAHERKLILDNPYSGIRLPKYRRKKITPMDDDQSRAFLLAARGKLDLRPKYTDGRGRVKRRPPINDRLFPLWASYLLLGERRGEGIGFLWQGWDRNNATIEITQQVQRVDGKQLQVRTTKTEDSLRTIPVPRRLNSWLCDLMERNGVLDEIGFIFVSEVGTPLWPDNIEARFRRIRDAAGLPKTVKLHHLRHTLATLLDECGCSEALKASILGHAKKTQSEKYTHGRIAAMRIVLQAVEDRLLGGFEHQF